MHPDYEGFYPDRKVIKNHAKWHDVKLVMMKLVSCSEDEVYVLFVNDGNWQGWMVEFRERHDLEYVKAQVFSTLVVSDLSVFISMVK